MHEHNASHCPQHNRWHEHRRGPEWDFRKLMQSYRFAMQTVFQAHGIAQYGQPMILFVLEHMCEDGMIATQKELAGFLGVTQTTTAVSLKSLERMGCIQRTADPRDMRRNQVEITEKGREVAKQFRIAIGEIDAAMYQDCAPEEKEQISHFFLRMHHNLSQLAEEYEKPCERREAKYDQVSHEKPRGI